MMKKIFMLLVLLCKAPVYAVNCLSPSDFIKNNTQWELTEEAKQNWYIYEQNSSSKLISLAGAQLTVDINNPSRAYYLACSYLLADKTPLLIIPVHSRKAKPGNGFYRYEHLTLSFTQTFYSCKSSADHPEGCIWQWQ